MGIRKDFVDSELITLSPVPGAMSPSWNKFDKAAWRVKFQVPTSSWSRKILQVQVVSGHCGHWKPASEYCLYYRAVLDQSGQFELEWLKCPLWH